MKRIRIENKEGIHFKKNQQPGTLSSWGVEVGGSGVEGLSQIPTNSAWTLWNPVSKTKQRSLELVLN